jgi:hypothetical protein
MRLVYAYDLSGEVIEQHGIGGGVPICATWLHRKISSNGIFYETCGEFNKRGPNIIQDSRCNGLLRRVFGRAFERYQLGM